VTWGKGQCEVSVGKESVCVYKEQYSAASQQNIANYFLHLWFAQGSPIYFG
jgi:hypothetical protein